MYVYIYIYIYIYIYRRKQPAPLLPPPSPVQPPASRRRRPWGRPGEFIHRLPDGVGTNGVFAEGPQISSIL